MKFPLPQLPRHHPRGRARKELWQPVIVGQGKLGTGLRAISLSFIHHYLEVRRIILNYRFDFFSSDVQGIFFVVVYSVCLLYYTFVFLFRVFIYDQCNERKLGHAYRRPL